MSKIRINELARELEVKPTVILDLLPELGVQDKKTHSSSLDDDVALAIRRLMSWVAVAPPAPEREADNEPLHFPSVPKNPSGRRFPGRNPRQRKKSPGRNLAPTRSPVEVKQADVKQEATPERQNQK